MEKPINLTFTDFEVPVEQIFRRAHQGPMNTTWTRTQFSVPDGFEAPRKVEEWIIRNTPGRWASYSYQNPKDKRHDYIMVVRFEDKNDALLFKLRGGHQAWES